MPNAASYTVPDNPADPEAAALDLIERGPADILHTGAFTEVLQDYCSVPHAYGAFAGLEWPTRGRSPQRSRGTSSAAMTPPISCVTAPAMSSPTSTALCGRTGKPLRGH